MTKLKTLKITLALFTILQFNSGIASEAAAPMPATEIETAISEAIELLEIDIPKGSLVEVVETFELIKRQYTEIYEEQFERMDLYPDMSLCDLGDAIIDIINKVGNKLPEDIKENLIKLINVKKMAGSIAEIKAGHALISDILVQIIDLKIRAIDNERSTLLKYGIISDDIAAIKKELNDYKKDIIKRKKRSDFKSPDDIKKDLKNINAKLEKIWLNHPIFLQIKRKLNIVDEKPLSMAEIAIQKAKEAKKQLDLMQLFNYRIAQNRKHK